MYTHTHTPKNFQQNYTKFYFLWLKNENTKKNQLEFTNYVEAIKVELVMHAQSWVPEQYDWLSPYHNHIQSEKLHEQK